MSLHDARLSLAVAAVTGRPGRVAAAELEARAKAESKDLAHCCFRVHEERVANPGPRCAGSMFRARLTSQQLSDAAAARALPDAEPEAAIEDPDYGF